LERATIAGYGERGRVLVVVRPGGLCSRLARDGEPDEVQSP
jgi:hypothetical protein